MSVSIVPFYAALLAGLYLFLSLRVIGMRVRDRIGLGDAGNPKLQRAIRVQGNFSEYVPLAVILLAFVEMQQASPLLLHGLSLSLLIGRMIHAYGVSQEQEDYRLRVTGMILTFAAIAVAGLILIGGFLF
ncbi:MAG: glutathione metabolism protein [Deltaproteobacteria bacterium RIFCSPLOWO2_12_FULL_60_19]|nr:MAG: glutathione metabolism protein [Deltaproteobacteria bacterium RIFCSPLOWO2_12_FULL_60_19]